MHVMSYKLYEKYVSNRSGIIFFFAIEEWKEYLGHLESSYRCTEQHINMIDCMHASCRVCSWIFIEYQIVYCLCMYHANMQKHNS